MTALRIAICFLALLSTFAARAQQPAAAGPQRLELDLPAYSASLERWRSGAAGLEAHPQEAGALRQSLPESVSVQVREGRVEVSTEWLRASVAEFERDPAKRKQVAGDIQQRLALMREEARSLERVAATPPGARAKLDEILGRREFHAVRPPNWFDRLRDQVMLWLIEVLDKLFGGLRRYPAAGEVTVWLVIAVALAVLVLWLKRALESAAKKDAPMHLETELIPSRTSAQWMADALAAAGHGNYRESVHCAYWAAISRVEEAGVVKPDRARTPREHLRRIPQAYAQRPLLAELTRSFEVIWYGYQAATAADFQQARAQLEQLGCLSHSKPATERS